MLKLFLFLLFCFPFFSMAQEAPLTGPVKVDGSSTVFPITEAVAEEFRSFQPKVRVTVGVSGTGGGFKKFTASEMDINNASRIIQPSEILLAKKAGLKYLELPVAYDGITIVVNKNNTWAQSITTAELKKIWQPQSKVKKWSDIRASWPQKELKLFGPGTDSGTFDYFTEAINGKSHACRSDFTKSEDDNILVTGVAGSEGALGFFGFAYYIENKDKLKALPVDGGKGPVKASLKTISEGSYSPLSRPVFIYVSKKSAQKPQVKSFIEFYLKNAGKLSQEVGYVSLGKNKYDQGLKDFEAFIK